MAFNNCANEISQKLEKIYTNKKVSRQSLIDVNNIFQRLRDYRFSDDCLSNFIKIIEQYCLILVEYCNNINGNEKYIPILRAALHAILSVINKHDLYRSFIRKSSTMLNKFLALSCETICLKEIFKFYNLCLTRTDKNSIHNFSTKHKVTCLKLFDWINSVRDIELQIVLVEILYRLIETNFDNFDLFTLEPELKQSFKEINLQNPYKQIREFLIKINNKSKYIYSIICKQIVIDNQIIPNVRVNDEILPVYLDFNLIDHRVSFLCENGFISEINEAPFNSLEFITFSSRHITNSSVDYDRIQHNFSVNIDLKNSILNLIPHYKLDKFRKFVFHISDELPDFNYFMNYVFTPIFPKISQIFLEESFDSTSLNSLSRINMSKCSIQSSPFLATSNDFNDFNNLPRSNVDDDYFDKCLSLSPILHNTSLLSTTFNTEDLGDDNTELSQEDNPGNDAVINTARGDQNVEIISISEQTSKAPSQPNKSGETTIIYSLYEEDRNSRVKQWLETSDSALKVTDDKIINHNNDKENDCNINNTRMKTTVKKPDQVHPVVEKFNNCDDQFDCIEISDDEPNIDKEKPDTNLNNTFRETLPMMDDGNCSLSTILEESNIDINNNQQSNNNQIIDKPVIEEKITDKSHQELITNNIEELNLPESFNHLINGDIIDNQQPSTSAAAKNDEKFNTRELISILEDTQVESIPTSIQIISSNNRGPRRNRNRSLFNPNESRFYEFDSNEESVEETKTTSTKNRKPQTKEKPIKTKKTKPQTNKKLDRSKKPTKSADTGADKLKKLTNEKKSSSSSFLDGTAYDFLKPKDFEPFAKLKDYVQTVIDKRRNKSNHSNTANATKPDIANNNNNDEINNDYDDDDDADDYKIASPLKGKKPAKQIKRGYRKAANLTKPDIVNNNNNESNNDDDDYEIASALKGKKPAKQIKRGYKKAANLTKPNIVNNNNEINHDNDDDDYEIVSPLKGKKRTKQNKRVCSKAENITKPDIVNNNCDEINNGDDYEIVSPFKGKKRAKQTKRILSDSDDSDDGKIVETNRKKPATIIVDNQKKSDKIQIISDIKLTQTVIQPKECPCVKVFCNRVTEMANDLRYHHPELNEITAKIVEMLK